jgi:hypothetical protein
MKYRVIQWATGHVGKHGCVATAMRLVNAIPAVCRAQPGVKSWLDLLVIAGRHAMR